MRGRAAWGWPRCQAALSRATLAVLLGLLLCLQVLSVHAQTQVAEGKALYESGSNPLGLSANPGACASCHFVNTPPDATQGSGYPGANFQAHPQTANSLSRMLATFASGGIMQGYFGFTAVNAPSAGFRDQAFKLALYVGQYKAPVFSAAALQMHVRSGTTATQDFYPNLLTDGSSGAAQDSGGLVILNTTANAASVTAAQVAGAATVAYNASYRSVANFTGTDSFSLRIVNPAGSATRAVTVTSYGITNTAYTATAARGATYTAGAPLYQVTSNDPNATFGATGLGALGLSLDAQGRIVGTVTAAAGDYPVQLTANISAATVGAANAGAVSRTLTVTVGAITSAATFNATQDQAIGSPYQIAANVGLQANSYTLSATPPGMSFSSATGQIGGTPTVSGSYAVTVGATTTGGQAISLGLTITVASAGPPVITTTLPASPAVTGTRGTPIAARQITASRPPITAGSYAASGLAATGLSLDANTGQISGTPTASGDFDLQLSAANSSGTTSPPLSWRIRINPDAVPQITSSSTASASANQPFGGYQVTASNPPLLSFAVVGPSVLPAGLSLDTATGQITGTPTASGNSTTTLRATNAAGNSANFSLAFSIIPTTVPGVTLPLAAAPVVTGAVGTPITPVQVGATNPPILSYGQTGLPAGLSINSTTGVISGTPTASGDFSVTASATNASGTGSSVAVTIRISPSSVPVITSAAGVTRAVNAPAGTVYQIVASNPLITGYAVVAPSTLPPGLALDTATGAITGSPTTSGNFVTQLSASNAAGTSVPFSLSFQIVPTSVPVVSSGLAASPAATGTLGTAIAPVQASATNPAITAFGQTGLPAGLSIDNSGRITGTPTQSGDFPVTVTATNAAGTGSAPPVTIRILPSTVPVITSAASVTATAHGAMAPYQITATNGPLGAFAVVAPSVLPAGLVLDAATGVISGTPTVSGSFSTQLRATNAAGSSAPFTVSFTVHPNGAPAITSPTFVSVGAGVALTPIQVVATNPAIQSYAATGLPPGLAIDAQTGVISGTPLVPGNFPATIQATNFAGTGSLVVPFTIGVPAPVACAMSVPLNTSTTLDLAGCLFNGFAPTGVGIVATPAHGSAVASGTRVTYTPAHNYFGADTFTFVGFGAGGTSPQGTVTVTVTGRPDPVEDPVVTAIVAAQAESAQRFSRAQISNFQRRMESLHRGAGRGNVPSSSLQRSAPGAADGFASAAGLSPAAPAPARTMPVPSGIPLPGSAAAIGPVLTTGPLSPSAPPSAGEGAASPSAGGVQALGAVAAGLGLQSLPLTDSLVSLAQSRTVNLGSLATGLGFNSKLPAADGDVSYWIEGTASFGTRDPSGGQSGMEFSSDGITVGVDKRFSDTWAAGMGIGYARDTTKIGTDGSRNRGRGYSLAVYGSYQAAENTYLDAMLGVGSLDFDTTRYVAPMDDFATGRRKGTQLFGSLTASYEFRGANTLVSPYGRLDFATSRLKSATETGAGAYALSYFGQTATSAQLALGVRGESLHAASFGYVVPMLRAELRHELQDNQRSFIAYADQLGGPRYALAPAGASRNALVVGLGSDFHFRDGLSLSVEYQLSHSFARDSSYALRLRLSKDFDAQGLPRRLGTVEPESTGGPLTVQVEAGYTHDDNITRAKAGPDRLSDENYSVNLSRRAVFGLSDTSRVVATGSLAGEKFRHFNGLSNLAATAEAEWQYRGSPEFDEPTFGLFGRLSALGFESSLRDGYRAAVGASVQQPLTDRIGIFGALSRNYRHARSEVFSTRDWSARLNVDYALDDNGTLYLGTEFRRGDIVSTGRASLENVSIADVQVQDDAFPGGQFFSYRFEGRTVLATLGYNLALGNRDSIDFSWRHIRSTPGLRPSFVTSPRSYRANQLSAVYLMRF